MGGRRPGAYMPLPASGSRRAAIGGCEGREGAWQTVKEPDRGFVHAGGVHQAFLIRFHSPQQPAVPREKPRYRSRTEEVAWGWIRAGSCRNGRAGHQRSPAVTNGLEKSQVAGRAAHAAGMIGGRFGLWSDGREGSSASPVAQAGTDEPPDRQVYIDDRGGTKAPPNDRCERSRDARSAGALRDPGRRHRQGPRVLGLTLRLAVRGLPR